MQKMQVIYRVYWSLAQFNVSRQKKKINRTSTSSIIFVELRETLMLCAYYLLS